MTEMRQAGLILLLAGVVLPGGATASGPASPADKPARRPRRLTYGIRKGLVMYLPLDSGGKKVQDASGAGNHGTVCGAKFTSAGRVGSAYRLDGKNDHITVPNSKSIEITSRITVALWVNLNSFKPGGYGNEAGYIVNKGDDLWWNPAFYLGYSKGSHAALFHIGSVRARVRGGKNAVSTTKLQPGKWYHLAGTYDGSCVKLYVNGELESAQPYSGPMRADRAPVHLGGGKLFGTDWGNHFTVDGTIDEVMIWERALGAAEARSLFTGIAPGVPYLTRSDAHDLVLLRGGRTMAGTILNETFRVAALDGKIALPAARVVGIVPADANGPGVRVVLADGQVIAGRLCERALSLRPESGRPVEVLASDVVECAYRLSEDKPSEPKAPAARVLLEDGNLLAWDGGEAVGLRTGSGRVDVPIASLLRLELVDANSAACRAVLRNGSVLTGVVAQGAFDVQLGGFRVKVPSAKFRGLILPGAPVELAGAAVLKARTGDRLFGRFTDKELTFRTAAGERTVPLDGILGVSPHPSKPGVFEVSTWDGASFAGSLVEKLLAVRLIPNGPTVTTNAADILSIDRSAVPPPPEVGEKIDALIAQLGATSYRRREGATMALIRIGRSIAPLLKAHLNSDDPEVVARVRYILKQLGLRE